MEEEMKGTASSSKISTRFNVLENVSGKPDYQAPFFA